ncbi:hypothetical protein [Actinomadura litoris]|uniref:Uncharacterized protein n=1 Tax=Actinomadura litoris TaxID=2678616 RepID=A0A7K1LAM9_9ACTN|nr:hypothetical protein [Actinomadura litoris]MUN41482.1 hypothetical protein [Actinomadura litoris]
MRNSATTAAILLGLCLTTTAALRQWHDFAIFAGAGAEFAAMAIVLRILCGAPEEQHEPDEHQRDGEDLDLHPAHDSVPVGARPEDGRP